MELSVGRRALYPAGAILDAARAVAVERGVRAVTVSAIAAASEAPTGSIYHRFASVQELLASLWLRAARRSQEASMLEVDGRAPLDSVVAAALGTYDFCAREPDDARLLSLFRREDFVGSGLPAELQRELGSLNDAALSAARAVAREFFGNASRDAVGLVLAAAVDVPYGLARPYLAAGRTPPAARRERIPALVYAMLETSGHG